MSKRRSVLVLGISTLLLAGCYTLQPARNGIVPEVGKIVAFDLNDAGRAALGGSIGPEIGQIEGRLIEKTADDYLIGVTAVRALRVPGEQVWKGEPVRVRREYITSTYERQFSKGRTVAASAVGVALVAAIFGRSILGMADPDKEVMPDTSETRRSPGTGRLPHPVRP